MTADHWFTLGQTAVTLTIGVLVFFWRRDREQASEAQRIRIETLERALGIQLDALKYELRNAEQANTLRFDQASHESSKLASMVQAIIGRIDRMPEEMRSRFLSLDVWLATNGKDDQ